MTADITLIKERFARRTGGVLPPPVAKMLESKHGMFDAEKHDLKIVSGGKNIDSAAAKILALLGR